MTSEVDICNLALGNIHAQSINALTDDNTEANACQLRYPVARDFVLSQVPWAFAGKDQSLALLEEQPAEWAFAYAWPSDCLEPRYLFIGGTRAALNDPIQYEVHISASDGQRQILTELEDACLKYTFRQVDTNKFSAHFIETLSWYVASQIAIPVAGAERGRELRSDSLQIYNSVVGAAIATDASQGERGPENDSPMIQARL